MELLTEYVALKDVFQSMYVHDVGNQLQYLAFLATKLFNFRGEIENEKVKGYIEKVYNQQCSVTDLAGILRNWLMAQKGKIKCEPLPIEVAPLAEQNIKLFNEKAKHKNIELSSDIPPNTSAYADKNMLLAVIRNLVCNALKFTKKGGGGWVKISAGTKGDITKIHILDNGLGMNQDELTALFDELSLESRDGTDNEKGTGMGFKICNYFVKLNNGSISVQSEPGKGSCFTITLPATEPARGNEKEKKSQN